MQLLHIDPADRLRMRMMARNADEAVEELKAATTEFNSVLQGLARSYPGSTGIGAIAGGTACSAFVYSVSAGTCHFSPVAPQQLRTLAMLIGNLPPDLVSAFQTELKHILTMNQLMAERDAALEAALATAETGRGEEK